MQDDDRIIERGETGVRCLLTLLFLLVAQVVEAVLAVVILFELVYALITRTPPSQGVRRFANQTLSYFYRVGRYLTYNDEDPPFPFDEFPAEVEPSDVLEGGPDAEAIP